MIGKLTGRIDTLAEDHLILDVNGVGYIVQASAKTLSRIGNEGSMIALLIESQTREDGTYLYGFARALEKTWFRQLLTVQGVGAKMALSLLSSFEPETLVTLIAAQDKKALTSANGVGPKLAERLCTELKSALGKLPASDGLVLPAHTGATKAAKKAAPSTLEDAVSALHHLGYGRAEAYAAAAKALQSAPEATLDSVIKFSLRELAA
jgi:Holliday junction DNA helicase RuvA